MKGEREKRENTKGRGREADEEVQRRRRDNGWEGEGQCRCEMTTNWTGRRPLSPPLPVPWGLSPCRDGRTVACSLERPRPAGFSLIQFFCDQQTSVHRLRRTKGRNLDDITFSERS